MIIALKAIDKRGSLSVRIKESVLNTSEEKNMDGIRKKHSEDVKVVEQEVESIDWISELPESVIHHIFSFICCPKEAARTSILSKKWRDAWKSFSILTFDEQSFLRTEVHICSNERKQKFVDFIDNSLLTYIVQNSLIYKLVLRITPTLIPYVNRWIRMAGAQGLSELDIHVQTNMPALMANCFNYPPLFLRSASALTAHRLLGMNWSNFQALRFSNLQKLHLIGLHVDQQIIQELVSISPLIIDLRIVNCHGFQDLTISGFLKLESVCLYRCCGLTRIELQVPSLQTFWYGANIHSRCKLNMESCISLKTLGLEDPFMPHTFLYKLLLCFPVLEKLALIGCHEFRVIKIPNGKLRCLALRNCNNLKHVGIGSVNPCSFDCEGSKMAFWRGQLCVREAEFSVSTNDISSRNLAFYDFLQSHCRQGFKVIVLFYKNIIIHDENKNFFLPSFLEVKFHIIKSSTDAKDLLNSLLTTLHPERIVVASSPSSDVPKALHEIERCEQPSCCRYNSANQCWRHFLKDAKIVDLEETERESDWFHGLNLKGSVDQITSMRLHWEPSVHLG